MTKTVIIETPKTELEMFNLTNEYNDMRASARKRAITTMFEERACSHGYILVGNAWYQFNGDKCVRIYHMDICEACHKEMEQEQAAELEQTEAAPETNPEPTRPEGYDIVEASQANTTRNYQPGEVFYIYASTSRPISGSWARIPDAVYVNAGLTKHIANGFVYTWVVVPHAIEGIIRENYELVLVYGPIIYKPEFSPTPEPDTEAMKAYDQEYEYDSFIADAAEKLNISINYFKSWQELDPEDKEDFLRKHGTEVTQ